jgi:transcriptional regulator GlxA family with amidase domain
VVRDAIDLIQAGAHLPLTTSTLAKQCHVSVRTLQEGFRRHRGISPMAYLCPASFVSCLVLNAP